MAGLLLSPLRDLLAARAGGAGLRAATVAGTGLFALVSATLAVAAGLAGLANRIGFPAAALIFAALFAVLALAVFQIGRSMQARRRLVASAAERQTQADIALAVALAVRSARPLLPLAAFFAAFMMGRRR